MEVLLLGVGLCRKREQGGMCEEDHRQGRDDMEERRN